MGRVACMALVISHEVPLPDPDDRLQKMDVPEIFIVPEFIVSVLENCSYGTRLPFFWPTIMWLILEGTHIAEDVVLKMEFKYDLS